MPQINLHHALRVSQSTKAEASVEALGVLCGQKPATHLCQGGVLQDPADQFSSDTLSAMFVVHPDVCEVGEGRIVRDNPSEADLPIALVDRVTAALFEERSHLIESSPLCPVGLLRNLSMYPAEVDLPRTDSKLSHLFPLCCPVSYPRGALSAGRVYAFSMEVTVNYVLAFGDKPGTGNPAGVVLERGELNEKQCLTVAAEVGASETAFLSLQESRDIRVRFFTPLKRIAFCGHATIASFTVARDSALLPEGSYLVNRGHEEFSVEIGRDQVFMRQQVYQEFALDSQAVEEVLETVFLSGPGDPTALVIGYTGVRFLLVHLPEESLLPRMEISQEGLYRFSEKHDVVGLYAFAEMERGPKAGTTRSGDEARPLITARMFAPYYGIEEESATGMAAGPAAHYLASRGYVPKDRFTIEQGRYMSKPSPSLIHVWFSPGDPEGRVRVGGGAYVGSERTVDL